MLMYRGYVIFILGEAKSFMTYFAIKIKIEKVFYIPRVAMIGSWSDRSKLKF